MGALRRTNHDRENPQTTGEDAKNELRAWDNARPVWDSLGSRAKQQATSYCAGQFDALLVPANRQASLRGWEAEAKKKGYP